MSEHASSVDGDGVGEIRAGAPMTLGNSAAARVRLIIVGLGSPLAGAWADSIFGCRLMQIALLWLQHTHLHGGFDV
jgi:hypothetical protein